jgi:hypothetical protein
MSVSWESLTRVRRVNLTDRRGVVEEKYRTMSVRNMSVRNTDKRDLEVYIFTREPNRVTITKVEGSKRWKIICRIVKLSERRPGIEKRREEKHCELRQHNLAGKFHRSLEHNSIRSVNKKMEPEYSSENTMARRTRYQQSK